MPCHPEPEHLQGMSSPMQIHELVVLSFLYFPTGLQGRSDGRRNIEGDEHLKIGQEQGQKRVPEGMEPRVAG